VAPTEPPAPADESLALDRSARPRICRGV